MKITKTDLKCGSQFFFISSHGKVVDPWRTKPLQIADLAWQVTSVSFGAITCLLNSSRGICRLFYEIMIDKQTDEIRYFVFFSERYVYYPVPR